jgi:iron complex transport system substrate-binding protein
MGVPVMVLPTYELEDIYTSIEALGRLVEKETKASSLILDIKQKIASLEHRVKDKRKVKVLFVYGHRPIVAAGPGTFIDTLLQLAHATNVLSHANVRYPTVPMEALVRLSPEVIIDASCTTSSMKTTTEKALRTWKRMGLILQCGSDLVHEW